MTKMRTAGCVALVMALVFVPGALSAPPSNDDFATPWDVLGEFASVNAGNAEATKQLGEPEHAGNPGGASVWFAWTAPRSGRALLDTCLNNFDTLLAVYTGTAVAALTEVVSNDDGCDTGDGSAVEFSAAAGVAYRIAVDGYNGAGDRFWLELRMRHANDNFGAALEKGLGVTPFHSQLATREAGEPSHRASTGSGSLWYRWTAPDEMTVELRVCTVSFNAVIEIYTGDSLAGLTPVPAQEIGCGAGRLLRLDVARGTTYRFVVDGASSADRGSGDLELAQVSVPPENLERPSITGTPRKGEFLTGNPGRWRWAREYRLNWERCVRGACTLVGGGPTYLVEPGDVGSSIRLHVVATAGSQQTTAISDEIGPVVAPTPAAPPVTRRCRVPHVKGKSLRAARKTLARARCRLGKVRRVRSARRRGVIVSQSPRPGTRLRDGAKVSVRVSLGRRR